MMLYFERGGRGHTERTFLVSWWCPRYRVVVWSTTVWQPNSCVCDELCYAVRATNDRCATDYEFGDVIKCGRWRSATDSVIFYVLLCVFWPVYSERSEGSDRELVDGASVDVRNHEMSMVRVYECQSTKSRNLMCAQSHVSDLLRGCLSRELFGVARVVRSCKSCSGRQSWKHGLLRSDSGKTNFFILYMYIVVLRRTFLKWGCV